MFTRKEKNMLFDSYFEVIRETEQFIEVRSVNTGHCWSVFKNIYNAPRKITLYHKHKESDRYFHQHRVCRTVVDAVSEIKSHDEYVLEEKTKQKESSVRTERRLKVHESSGYTYGASSAVVWISYASVPAIPVRRIRTAFPSILASQEYMNLRS